MQCYLAPEASRVLEGSRGGGRSSVWGVGGARVGRGATRVEPSRKEGGKGEERRRGGAVGPCGGRRGEGRGEEGGGTSAAR